MLLGKLATPATKVYQDGAFSTTTATAEFMTIGIQKFAIGEKIIEFEVRFGNVVIENEKERFDIILRSNVKMTTQELSTWGTDDSIVLELIAIKIGTTIVEKITKDIRHTY